MRTRHVRSLYRGPVHRSADWIDVNPPVPELQIPAAPAHSGATVPLPRTAPGALIRTTLLTLPAEPGPAALFRAALAELVVLEGRLHGSGPRAR